MRHSELLARFAGAQEEESDGIVVQCPAHADGRPSLKVTLKADGRALLVCRAGCRTGDILSAVGLKSRDLFGVQADGAVTVSAVPPVAAEVGDIAALRMFVDHTAAQLAGEPAALAYLSDRFGLTPELAAELDIGYAAPGRYEFGHVSAVFRAHPRITVPLTDADGIARGLQGRDIGGRCPARWVSLTNPGAGRVWQKWGLLSSGAGYGTILVTEGPGDGLTTVAAGYDALVIRGAGLARNKALLDELVMVLRGRDVVLAGDHGSAGAGFNAALGQALTDAGETPRVLTIPGDDDLTAWRESDPNAFAGQLHRAVRSASAWTSTTAEPTPPATPETGGAVQLPASARVAFDATDVGLAVRLRDFISGVRYTPGIGFLVWGGRCWEPGDARVRQAVHEMGVSLLSSADPVDRDLGLKSLSSKRIDAILTELPSVPGVYAAVDDWDSHLDLLSVGNGTLDLRTGVLRPHSADDLITQCLDVNYVPTAKAGFWEQFLADAFPEHPEMPDYLRRLNGYGITGHTSEQMFVFHFGSGQNGKSVYTDNLGKIFSAISKPIPFSAFEAKRAGQGGAATPELAKLRGYRMAMANETEQYTRLAEAFIKESTGGSPITARELHKNPITFTPRFLLQVAGNHKPAIVSQDHGIWRRVRLIPWEARFEGAKKRPRHEVDAAIQAEAEGVLAWAVRGAQEWYTNGLGIPRTIQEATQEYRESEDRLAEFIESALVVEPGASISPTELRVAYNTWMSDAGFTSREVLAGRSLGLEMDARGFRQRRNRRRRWYDGIRLKTEAEKHREVADEATDIFGQSRGDRAK